MMTWAPCDGFSCLRFHLIVCLSVSLNVWFVIWGNWICNKWCSSARKGYDWEENKGNKAKQGKGSKEMQVCIVAGSERIRHAAA